MKQHSCVQLCSRLLKDLGWSWEHPRILNWLSRVGMTFTGKPYTLQEPIPEYVYVSLAKFLDLRLRCDRTLVLLRWDWSNPKVKEVEARYRCVGQLPLKGYQELFKILDEAWFLEGGGF